MSRLWEDTDPRAEAVTLLIVRGMPLGKKLSIMGGMAAMARQMAVHRLRQRYPDASESEIRHRLAALVMGQADAERVYGRGGGIDLMKLEPAVPILYVVGVLDRLNIAYVIGGSIAASAYGVYRMTGDVDMLAKVEREHIAALVAALAEVFYIDSEMIADAIQRRSSFNLIHYKTGFKVDIFIPKERAYDRMQLERRVAHIIDDEGGRSVYVVSPEDLILTKLAWFRLGNESSERQWQDIREVLRAMSGQLNATYLRHWAAELKVADLLDRALAEAEQ